MEGRAAPKGFRPVTGQGEQSVPEPCWVQEAGLSFSLCWSEHSGVNSGVGKASGLGQAQTCVSPVSLRGAADFRSRGVQRKRPRWALRASTTHCLHCALLQTLSLPL